MFKHMIFCLVWWAAAGWNVSVALRPGLAVGWRVLVAIAALTCFCAGAEQLERYIKGTVGGSEGE